MSEKNDSRVRLNDNLLTVGADGINANYNEPQIYFRGGRVTSSGSSLVIRSHTYGSAELGQYGEKVFYSFGIDAVISDNKNRKVGLVINGGHKAGERGLVSLFGERANTFTGDVIVEGEFNQLYLAKQNGVQAVRGNIYIKDKGAVVIDGSDQIADSSTVTLSGSYSTLRFIGTRKDIREKIKDLVVTNGQGVMNFTHDPRVPDDSSKKTLFLDDLIIKNGASLRIASWQAGRDHLLVRKDSKHLADALKKITIDGWAKNQIYLKDYDKDYWSIEAAPEPATCGALLGALGLGLVAWRRRRSPRASSSSSL
ncbi:PEP-CTERM sorting domain-containing protein [Cephaloticoccus primus]|uniref:PEP-CTERM sorting domain-containing protein n=1 Tax=Cephaloticoccus primus TaxID=1548207 RepID=UPI0012E9064B|nr:PEP-CTERM sorting domain-containing protein [Cephaloticoccus primus]